MVIGYCRVSTDEQAQNGYGLAVQEERVRAYATAMGQTVDEVIVDDGYSGKTLDRPGLQRLIALIGEGSVESVITAKVDRLSRSLRNLLNLYADTFEAHGVALVSVAEQFDTSTAAGRLMFQMMGSFAEFERSLITERTLGGRKKKAAEGGHASGRAPIGYRAKGRALVVDEDGAALVRRLFGLHAENPGLSLQKLADALMAEGFKGPAGGTITRMQVSRILAREAFYRGEYSYAGTTVQGQHEAIL